MYDLVRGPLVWVAFALFVLGLIYQWIRFLDLTKRKDPIRLPASFQPRPAPKKKFDQRVVEWFSSLRRTVWYSHSPVMVMTTIFHLCLIVTPFLVLGHSILLDESWGLRLWSVPEWMTDGLTVVFLVVAAYFLVRRLFVPRVRAITDVYDYGTLIVAVAPFLTGFLAYHQWFDYRAILSLHILAGEVMLILSPFTKLGHMLYFFLYRFFIGTEYSFSQGSRIWSSSSGRPLADLLGGETQSLDRRKIKGMLDQKKGRMKRLLSHCVHCSICAESCFLYMAHERDPQYMPSYKVINSLGVLYKKKGRVNLEELKKMKEIVWRNCVLCGRCYCPIGVHVPSMITFARSICRSQGIYPEVDGPKSESWL